MSLSHAEDRLIAQNRRAYYDYHIIDTLECGIELRGGEVKSIRNRQFSFNDAFARIAHGELWLHNFHINLYRFSTSYGEHDPRRARRLLAHRREIQRLYRHCTLRQRTLALLDVHYSPQNRVKVMVGLCVGKKLHDKREAIKERDMRREMDAEK